MYGVESWIAEGLLASRFCPVSSMPHEAGAVKTAAALDASSPTQQDGVQRKLSAPLDNFLAEPSHPAEHQENECYNQQQRQEHRDDPAGGPSTSSQQMLQAQRHREHSRVKFATLEDEVTAGVTHQSGSPGPTDVHATGHAQQQQQQRGQDEPAASSRSRGAGDSKAEGSPARGSFLSRMKKSLVIRSGHEGNDGSGTNRIHHGSSGVSQADWTEPGSPAQGNKPAPSEHSQAMSSFSLRGLLGGASSRLLGSLMGRMSSASRSDAEEEEEEELWFTSLDDFKPICHMLHRGHYMTAYFACANKTGQHFLLKKYDKHKMVPAEERGVRRAIAFSELLHHPNLVRCVGQWEEADTIYVVEEYVGKGDIFNDCISHPEKYTERHVAVALVKPLLKALAYLHTNNIIHRSVLPENLYMGIDDVLRLGHLTLSVDQLSDRPKSRTALLDYMAPEMLSVKPHNEHELALGLLDDSSSEEDDSTSPTAAAQTAAARGSSEDALCRQQPQQQQQQQQAGDARVSNRSSCSGQQTVLQQQHSQQPLSQPDSKAAAAGQKGKGDNIVEGVAAAVRETSRSSSHHMRSGASISLGAAANEGRADWEYRDYYDEKVDIWQVGCMVHELLCGSMPFEVEAKIDSAGLALWADIEQPPGSLPPDCVNFIQLTLTKDPRQRPSAEALLEHQWLARCEAGEPWRDPAELAAARKAAELATVWGWLRHNSKAAIEAVGSLAHYIAHGRRVSPLISSWEQQQQQQAMDGTLSGPASPSKLAAASLISFTTVGATPSLTGQNGQFGQLQSMGGGISAPRNSLTAPKQGAGFKGLLQSSQGGSMQLGAVNSSWDGDGQQNSNERPAIVPPLKLTEDIVGRLNAGWNAAHESLAVDEDHGDGYVAACVVKTGIVGEGVGTAGKVPSAGVLQQQRLVL